MNLLGSVLGLVGLGGGGGGGGLNFSNSESVTSGGTITDNSTRGVNTTAVVIGAGILVTIIAVLGFVILRKRS